MLVEELRALARTRSAVQFAETPAPQLDGIVLRRDLGRRDGRQGVVDDAIDAIGYPQYQESARLLLGSHTDRWQALTQRGELAAAQFGISYDGFRRARTASPSRLDETLAILAGAILLEPKTVVDQHVEAGHRATGGATDGATESPTATSPASQVDSAVVTPGGPDAETHRPLYDTRRARRRSPILAGAIAALGALLLVVALLVIRSGGDDETASPPADATATGTPDPGTPQAAPDCPTPDTSSLPEFAPYVEAFADQAADVAADPANGCPTGGLQSWDAFVFQQFANDDGNTGVLASTSTDGAIWFTDAQWGSYHQVGGKSGDNAQALMGLAQAPEQHDGYVVIPTDTDAILVGETPDSPHFFLLGPAREAWQKSGGSNGSLGLPVSNPVVIGGALTQDFQRGYLEQLADASVVTHLVPDPGAELPPLEEIRDKIVRHPDATSWYVAPDGRRYWIPSGEVWECVGGANAQVDNDIRGYAIATLPYGGPATC